MITPSVGGAEIVISNISLLSRTVTEGPAIAGGAIVARLSLTARGARGRPAKRRVRREPGRPTPLAVAVISCGELAVGRFHARERLDGIELAHRFGHLLSAGG